MSAAMAGATALLGLSLYAGHHVGDYWVQTDHQATHKGREGKDGRVACASHVLTYTITQAVFTGAAVLITGLHLNAWAWAGALCVSAVSHYLADRRDYGAMFRLARLLPGKANFLQLGVPRAPRIIEAWFNCAACEGRGVLADGMCWDCQGGGKLPRPLTVTDNPCLGTGGWALDQSWHIFWGVFVAALVMGLGAT